MLSTVVDRLLIGHAYTTQWYIQISKANTHHQYEINNPLLKVRM